MSYHYLQEEAEGYGQAESLDGTPFVRAKSIRAPGISCLPDSETVPSTASLSGTTCAPSPVTNGLGESISSQAASPAKTYRLPGKEMDSTESVHPSGSRWPVSLARYDPASSTWRTVQPSLFGDSTEFSDRFPAWGSMRNGELYPLPTPVLGTDGRGYGFLPTISATDTKGRSGAGHIGRHGNKRLSDALLPTPTASIAVGGPQRAGSKQGGNDLWQEVGGSLNPEWVEWFMGWPVGSTSLLPLENASLSTWDEEPAIPRTVTVKVENWSKRIKALGNGQVPQAFLLAWRTLE